MAIAVVVSLGLAALILTVGSPLVAADAELLPVLAWKPVGGEIAYARSPCPALLRVWEQDARDRLRTALDQAFGGTPGGLVIHPAIVRGPPGPVLVWIAGRPDDLLVVGCGAWGPLGYVVHGAVGRYCLAHARCPVLAVPAPEMIRELRARRHWRPEGFAAPGPDRQPKPRASYVRRNDQPRNHRSGL